VTTVCYGSGSPFGPEAQCPAFTGVTTNYIINANKAQVKGFELGAALRATNWLTLTANYAYTDSKYKDFQARDVFPAPSSAALRQFGGNRVQWIPKSSLSGSARVEAPVMDNGVKGFFELDGRYRTAKYVRFDNRVRLAPKAVFDLQTGLQGEGWSASIFVENLFNDKTPDFTRYYGNWNPNRTNGEYIVAPAKRAIGLRASKEF
jgi:outer membrane receptor protein involved in Fe transport